MNEREPLLKFLDEEIDFYTNVHFDDRISRILSHVRTRLVEATNEIQNASPFYERHSQLLTQEDELITKRQALEVLRGKQSRKN